ncbi:hypothetical protein CD30_04070 [Ureibacillus massiliensis 4400831 = CIP 108448 = CCUG 49529]|uniref:Bifunctional NAD(P)H-hydrate repair enzyme n=1 Tax=Ureibacillus massiliensis 4400831 = CIP 108448 = CCUG 49529 TaxID=1211035 RepID=A0A0A3J4A4_9BACL|nr:bifunctional ADP-dependent NAD(P)H-hydrate dehydratase/NAD(P)H-hydrate epimerase [Ureibacillus massiliensis]KGR91761.1 hypothetical protein CD30_04070 [Ureibacillus massiliensis 4400831 = CIP 108448 = CCUG 49529]
MYVANQNNMQLLDQYTIETLGLPGIVLMENAGFSVVQEIINRYPDRSTKIIVFAGSGNNGGDGFVIARRLIDFGYSVKLFLSVPDSKLKGDAKVHYDVYKMRKLPIHYYEKQMELQNLITQYDIIVDALLGTGSRGEVRKPIKDVIQAINDSGKPVYAVDIPSGLNANTGEVANIAVKATYTITFAMPKVGFFVGQGPQFIGEWKVVDISVPPSAVEKLQLKLPYLLDDQKAKQSLPKRIQHGHKGTFGHCLVIGGSKYYVGAPIYSSKAAFQTGVGLVSLAIPNDIYPFIAAQCPESLLVPLQSKDGFLASNAFESIDFSPYKSIAFGPGLSREVDGEALWNSLLSKITNQTLIVDADGLYFFKRQLQRAKDYPGNIILTPHPGEMSTLTGLSVFEIESNRIEIAKEFAIKYGVYLILKGHRPIIATPEGNIWINPHGNDGLGKGGSGDVLTGMITSFVAQGAEPLQAVLAASYYHAKAAENLSLQKSTYGITPSDIIEYVATNL